MLSYILIIITMRELQQNGRKVGLWVRRPQFWFLFVKNLLGDLVLGELAFCGKLIGNVSFNSII